jgi:hypothetical protein
MIAETIPGLDALTSDQKILLAAELWRAAVGKGAELPNPALVQALQERLDFHNDHPEEGLSWAEVRARIVARKSS